MTEERQQELKKLLVSNDFQVEKYKELDMQEIIILCQTGRSLMEQNKEDENAFKFFETKSKFLYNVVLEKLKVLDEMFVLFSKGTNMPYIHCDEETFNDQIFIFSREQFAQREAAKLNEEKNPVQIIKFNKDQFLGFYINLFPMGANAVVIDRGVNSLEIQLEELCKKPDYTNAPKEKIPVLNPELQLTALYFMQELRRPVEKEEKQGLRELEEEMLVNIRRGNYLVPIQFQELKEGEEEPKELTRDNKNIMVPFVKYENGDVYQPVFTDPGEFHKFNKEKKFRAIAMPFQNLNKVVVEQAKGIVLNPMGFNLLLVKGQLNTKGE